MKFNHYNANPQCKDVGDCTIRAISKCEEVSWEQTYKNLFKTSLKLGNVFNSSQTLDVYLKERYDKYLTNIKFSELEWERNRKYLLLLKKKGKDDYHLVFSENGNYYDTFYIDPKQWIIVAFYKMKKGELK